jgi:tRNA-specific adenosine deaminase 3
MALVETFGTPSFPRSGSVVLPFDATRQLELMDGVVAWVAPQRISVLIRSLDLWCSGSGTAAGSSQPATNVGHLKRVHSGLAPPAGSRAHGTKLAVLLCAGTKEDVALLPKVVLDELPNAAGVLQLVRIPRYAPLTRAQFEVAMRIWPIHFHEAAATRTLALWALPPAASEHAEMRRHMLEAIRLAVASKAGDGRPIAALMVRTDTTGTERIVAACADATRAAIAGDGPCGHPLAHALMRCVDVVAFAECGERGAARGQTSPLPPAGSKRRAEGNAAREAPAPVAGGAHLCVGVDVYMTLEPCAMCAMAMVHSRVRRLVYALPADAHGALGSRHELHVKRPLNHHFQVVRGWMWAEAVAAGLSSSCGESGSNTL